MSMVRGLLALLLLPFLAAVPVAAADLYGPGHGHGYGYEHCSVATEEMDMIFIRDTPKSYAKIEKRLNPGECGIDVVGHCSHGWCPVQQGRFEGWMHRDQLAPMSAAVYCVPRGKHGWSVDVHEGPGRGTKVVVSVSEGTCGIAMTPFHRGHWVRIKVAGFYGWVGEASIR